MLLRATGTGAGDSGGDARDLEAIAGENGLPGQIVYADNAGVWKLARSDAIATARGYGFLLIGMTTFSLASAINAGQVEATTTEWDTVTGQSGGLTAGAQYFLSRTTAGNITTTAPPPGVGLRLIVGKAITSTRMAVELRELFDASEIGQFLVSVDGVDFTAQAPAVSDLGEIAVDDTGLVGVVG